MKALKWNFYLASLSFGLLISSAQASCLMQRSDGGNVLGNSDYLARLLSKATDCPKNVIEFRNAVIRDGMQFRTTMVANRGFHNPSQGSFSLFEMIVGSSSSTGLRLQQGDFFFGHFTEAKGNQLVAAQQPDKGALMIELIGWDATKRVFNFYELIGDGTQGRWFFRGDSHDIQRDARLLHLQPNPGQPVFGKTLRCAGCHIQGGPIMKELAPPHNDWWTPNRRLPGGGRKPDPELAWMLQGLIPADQLAQAVLTGVQKLQLGGGAQASLSLREKLRPLFCPMEVNFESSPLPGEQSSSVQIPSAFFVDPRLASLSIAASKGAYDQAMASLGMRFPEGGKTDGDHPFLAPVKATSDIIAIEALKRQGILNDEVIADILAVDYTNPVFSAARCGLLRFVPESAGPNWQKLFASNLQRALTQPAPNEGSQWAPVLQVALANLTDPARNLAFHRAEVQAFLKQCASHASTAMNGWVLLLAQRRNEIRASEISKNPRGQILEPGFRVIFPEPSRPVTPGSHFLTQSCEVR
jgi:hypothetical protein